VTDEEKESICLAIREINKATYPKFMSQATLATYAGIKATKVRAILVALIEEGRITQYRATENKHLQRYYYVINDVVEQGIVPENDEIESEEGSGDIPENGLQAVKNEV